MSTFHPATRTPAHLAHKSLARREVLAVVLGHGHGFLVPSAHRILELDHGLLEYFRRHAARNRKSLDRVGVAFERGSRGFFRRAGVVAEVLGHLALGRAQHLEGGRP